MTNKYQIGDIFVSVTFFSINGKDMKTLYTITGYDRRRNNQFFYELSYYREELKVFYTVYEHEETLDRWISMKYVEHYSVIQ